MLDPVILTCPIVGAELTRDIYPNLPLSPEELAEAARGACEAGASIIHLHVRDELGNPTQRVDIFAETTKKIRERCDCILQFSTGGAVGTPLEERLAPLELRPDMATLSMGTMNFSGDIFENRETTIIALAEKMKELSITPELEIFDYGMMDTVDRFVKKGYLPANFHMDFVLGVPGGMNGEISSLNLLVQRLPKNQTWSVAGVGRFQLSLGTHAMVMGGHVRAGLEDNIFYRKGELAQSNGQLIARFVRLAELLDRPVASVEETRKILKLTRGSISGG